MRTLLRGFVVKVVVGALPVVDNTRRVHVINDGHTAFLSCWILGIILINDFL
jgi:hypothetical protein